MHNILYKYIFLLALTLSPTVYNFLLNYGTGFILNLANTILSLWSYSVNLQSKVKRIHK